MLETLFSGGMGAEAEERRARVEVRSHYWQRCPVE